MSKTQYIEYRDRGFWAYDVALAVFLKHVIDTAEPRAAEPGNEWLAKSISWWRVVAVVSDYGLEIDPNWSTAELDVFVKLADRACSSLAQRDAIPAEEISSWPILDDLRIFPRGVSEVHTAPVVELGRAIIALIDGSLAAAPSGTAWLYGAPAGRTTIAMSH